MKKNWCKFIVTGLCFGLFLWGCGNVSGNKTEEKVIEGIEALSTERPSLTTQHDTEEEIITEEVTTESGPKQEIILDLEEQLKELVEAEREKGLQVSVYIEKISDASYVSFSGGQMKSGSLIKLFVAGCVYEQMESLTDSGNLAEDIESLVKKMIVSDDDESTDILVRMLGKGLADSGMRAVNDYCRKYGFDVTSMGRLMSDTSAENDNYTSVTDCARFLRLVNNGTLLGSEFILEYLKQQGKRNGIPSVIPTDVKTANKTGELSDSEHDVAIVYADGNAYILCIMTGDLQALSAGRNFITNISTKTYAYMTQ